MGRYKANTDDRVSGRTFTRKQLLASVASIVVLGPLSAQFAQAAPVLPTGGQFAAGAGTIGAAGPNALQINQLTARGVIDWRNFSIGAGGSVAINNGTGATLNRVTGGQMSLIQGSLSATGSLYLVNPQGVVIGPGGQVLSGGSVVISSRNIANDAFMAGGAMAASGTSVGDITNKGTVLARAGDVIIIGHSVTNSGSIQAPAGTATLAAANSVILQPVGGASGVVVQSDAKATGDVTQTGLIQAAAAALTAAGGNVYSLAGNTSGLVQATGTSTVNGHVYLTASNGTVSVAGAVAAKAADGSGGDIVVSGKTVSVAGTAHLDASGTSGGQVLVGVSAPQTGLADTTTISDGATLLAGGPAGGGHVETSGHVLNVGAVTVNAGKGGSWLLDPTDLTVTDATSYNTSLAAGTTTAITTTGNLTLSTATPITWSSAAALNLSSGLSLNINSAINGTGAGALTATTTAGAITVAAAVKAGTVSMTATGGNLAIASGSVIGTAAGATAVTLNTTANFVNTAGAGAVVASGAGANWRIYSTNPALDTVGGLTPAFYQYHAAIGAAASGTGNGLLYSIAPTVNYSVIGTATKVYDGSATATGLTSANISATGLINSDAAAPTGGTGTYSQSDVGNSLTVTIAGLSFTHGAAPVYGYTIGTAQNVGVIGSITAKQLGVTLQGSLDKIYDGTTATNLTSANFGVTGVVPTESITVVPGPADSSYAGTEAGVQTVNVALSTTSYSAGAGTKLTNYILPSAPTAGATTGTIQQAPLQLLGLQANNKQYDATATATLDLSHAQLYGAVAADAAGLTLVTSGSSASFAAGPNVGTGLVVNTSGFTVTGVKANDYLAPVPASTLKANITAAPLTVTGVTAQNKAYDGTTTATLNAGSAALSGVIGSDSVSLVSSTAGTFSQANVANGLAVSAGGFSLSGGAATNYALTQPTGMTANITPAVLSVALGGTTSKVYDGSDTAIVAPGGFTVTGWATGEGGHIGQVASATYATPNAGATQVTANLEVSDFAANSGTLLSNYTVTAGSQTFTTSVQGAASITPAPLTIGIVGNPTKVFDGTTTATLAPSNFTIQGFVGSENATVTKTAATYASATAGIEGVSITLANSDFATSGGTLMSNYSFTNPVTGFGTITPAALMGNIYAQLTGNPTKVYDGNNSLTGLTNANFILTGWVGGDIGNTDVHVTKTTGTYSSVNVGQQPISVTLTNGDFASTTTNLNNYTLPNIALGVGTITAKALTASITGNPTKIYNGTTDATLAPTDYTLVGLVTGEHVSITQNTGSYGAADAGAQTVTASIPVSDIVAGANANTGGTTLLSNYTLPTTAAGAGTITKATLTVLNAFGVDKVYDGSTAATLNVAGDRLFGVVSADSTGGNSISLVSPTTGTFSQKDVNGAPLTVTPTAPFSLTTGGTVNLNNYTLVQPTLTANITQATLTVTSASAASRAYDGTTGAVITASGLTGVLTSTGAPQPDDVTLVTAGGTGTFSQSDVGNGLHVTASGFSLTGALAADYKLVQPTGLTANITPAILTATIVNDPTKTYDGSQSVVLGSTNYSITGWAAGQGTDVTVVQAASAGYAQSNAGNAVTVTAGLEIPDFKVASGATPTKLSNYALPTTATGTGTINKAPLIAQIVNNPTKIYDSTQGTSATNAGVGLTSGNYSVLGFVGSQGVTVSQNTGVYNSQNAGINTITSTLTAGNFTSTGGADLNNYILPTTALGAGTITPFALTVTGAVAQNKVYDTTTAAVVTGGTPVGVFASDLGNVSLSNGTGTFASKDVANGIAVTLTGNLTLSGSAATNYTVIQPTGLSANITPAPLVVKVTKTYDTTNDAGAAAAGGTSYSLQGVLGSDSVALGATGGITGTYSSANIDAVLATPAVTLTGATLAAGGQSGDYQIVSATGVINPKQLTISGAVAQDKVYNGNTAAIIDNTNTALNGVLAGDVGTVVLNPATTTPTVAGTFASKDVNLPGHPIAVTTTAYSVTGNTHGNYSLQQPTGLSANITPATLLVNLTNVTKVYDNTNALPTASSAYTLGGIIAGDTVNVSSAVGTYDSIHVGTNLAVSISALNLGGAQASDYTVVLPAAHATIGTITAAPLTLSIIGAPTKTYDGSTSSTLAGANYQINGLKGTDTASVTADALLTNGATYNSKNVATATTLTVTGVSASEVNFSGALSTDYSVTATASGAGTITPITLGVTLASKTKAYDGTAGVTLASGDFGLTGFLAGDNGTVNQTAGTYANINVLGAGSSTVSAALATSNISGTGGYVTGNYVLPTTVSNTTSTITPVTLTASLATQTKTYDGNVSATGLTTGSYTLTGLVHGETATVGRTSGHYNSPNVTTAAHVTVGDGSAGNLALTSSDYAAGAGTLGTTFVATNYVLPTSITGLGTITPKTVTASIIGNPIKVYNATTGAVLTAANYQLTGFVGSDGGAVSQTVGTYNFKDVPTGNLVTANITGDVTVTAGLASNYTLPTTASGAASITPAPLTVAGLAVFNKVYDGTTAATLDTSHAGVLTGVFVGDTVTLQTGPNSATFISPNVGNAIAVNLSGGSITGAQAANYVLNQTGTIAANITPLTLTAAIIGTPTKTYDGNTGATLTAANFALTGFLSGQSAGVTQTVGTYASPNAGSQGVTASLAAGNFTAGSGTLLSNYILPTNAAGTGLINRAILTASIIGTPTKTFDGNTGATLTSANFLLAGFVSGQGAGVTQTAGAYAAAAAGSEGVTAVLSGGNFSANSGTLLSNYVLPVSAAGQGLIIAAVAPPVTTPTTPTTPVTITTGNPTTATTGELTEVGSTITPTISFNIQLANFAIANVRTYIPYPAPGALSTWRNNGWGTLPIVVDETTDYARSQDDNGNLAIQSGPPVINSTEQVLTSGVKNKRWRITVPRFTSGPSLGALQTPATTSAQ